MTRRPFTLAELRAILAEIRAGISARAACEARGRSICVTRLACHRARLDWRGAMEEQQRVQAERRALMAEAARMIGDAAAAERAGVAPSTVRRWRREAA